jgi:hypothetical protein
LHAFELQLLVLAFWSLFFVQSPAFWKR